MAGMIERMAKTPAVLKQPSGTILDGKVQFTTVNCVVFRLGGSQYQASEDEYGKVQFKRVFLVAPLETDPVLPGTITVSGCEYAMSSVKTYRNMRGQLYGYLITVAGGA